MENGSSVLRVWQFVRTIIGCLLVATSLAVIILIVALS
jgi:hypothetical protein